MSLRQRVVTLYKTLHHLGNDYPQGKDFFHKRLKTAFLKNKDEKDPAKIEEFIKRGEFIVKEIEALYRLKKYRAMKNRYYQDDDP